MYFSYLEPVCFYMSSSNCCCLTCGPITAWQIEGEKVEVVTDFLFLGSKITTDGDCSQEIRRWFCFLAGKWWWTWIICLKAETYSTDKGPYSQGYGLPSGHIQLWELDSKESRATKNWCLQTVVLEDSWKSLGQQGERTNLKGNQPWILVGRTDAEAEVPIFWSSDVNRWFIGKVPDAGKDWGQKKKRASEDEMAGWHHRCNGRELSCSLQTLGDGEWPGVLQSMGSLWVR